MQFSNRGRFLPRRALPYQRLASWEPRTGHARADGAQKGGASNTSRAPILMSPLVFPSLSSAFVLGALLLSPSLTIATTDVVAERAGENVACKKSNDMFFEHIISYFTCYAVHLMGGVVGMGGAQKGGASNSPARK